jgi:hypothetical protein
MLAVLLLPGIASGAPAARPAGYASPQSLVLNLTDISRVYGSRFSLGIHEIVSNSLLGRQYASMFNRDGRITGYVAVYTRNPVRAGTRYVVRPGVTSVLSGVNVYQNPTGPRREFNLPVTTINLPRLPGLRSHRSTLGGVGDQATLITYNASNKAAKNRLYGAAVSFRRGSYLANVNVNSNGTFSTTTAVTLARVLDDRIRKHG